MRRNHKDLILFCLELEILIESFYGTRLSIEPSDKA